MNRELKFRAWDTQRSQFVDAGEIQFAFYGNTTISVIPNSMNYIGDEIHSGEPQRGRFVIEQYIGIKDVNGQEIYEGDLLDYGLGRILEVRFHNAAFVVGIVKTIIDGELTPCEWKELPINPKRKEIIGNIHQNPELTK